MADDFDPDTVYDPERNVMHCLKFQFTFYPASPTRLLTGPLAERLPVLFREGCEMNVWQLHEISIEPTEVHLLIQTSDTCSLDDAANALHGRASRILRVEFPDLEEWAVGDKFWDEEYSVESVGGVNENAIKEFWRLSEKWKAPDEPEG